MASRVQPTSAPARPDVRRSPGRVLRRLGLGLLVLIVGLLILSAISNIGLPAHSQMVEQLHPLEKARLEEAIHLRQALGDSVWSGWGQADIPLLAYNEAYAFLTGYDNPPAGWRTVPGGEMHGGAWERVPGDDFGGVPYYRQPLPEEVTPQSFIVRIGDREVASLATMEWMKIGLREEIREHLPPFLAPFVPYRLLDRVFLGTSDWYIATLLHEAFHGYQNVVTPSHLAAAEQAAEEYEDQYPWADDTLHAAWQEELELLAEAVGAPAADAPRYAQQFLTLREQRRAGSHLSLALARYEQEREWLEGLAKYTELEIWRQAATNGGYQPLSLMANDPWFRGYRRTFEQRWLQEIAQIRRMAGDEGDGRFYYTGWAQAVLLDRLAPGWKQAALEQNSSLEAMLRQALSQ